MIGHLLGGDEWGQGGSLGRAWSWCSGAGRCLNPFPILFQPSGRGVRLPEVFCIISCLGCFGLFSKVGMWCLRLAQWWPRQPPCCLLGFHSSLFFFPQILDEVEKRRQISMAVIYPFMQGLRESPFPAPGKTVTIKSFIPESGTEVGGGLGVSVTPSGLLQRGEPGLSP